MELIPEERLLAAAIRLAIKDATKHKSEHIRAEAWRWLWMVAPRVAERAGLSELELYQIAEKLQRKAQY